MIDQHFIILYVNNPTESTLFYSDLLDKPPVEASPAFAMFALDSGVMLGLWDKANVIPPTTLAPGCGELAFNVGSNDNVSKTYANWLERTVPIIQTPLQMEFGFNFVGLDPDGHRLRVFAPQVS